MSKKGWVKWTPWVVWLFVLVAFIFSLRAIPEYPSSAPENTSDASKKPLQDLAVYNQNRTRYGEWDRGKAIEFGLNQVAATINYLFVAAAAILAFVAKTMVDPLTGGKQVKSLKPSSLLLLKHSAIGCLASISFGFFARSYFNNIGDRIEFSIYDECGVTLGFQILSLVIGGLFLVVAVNSIANDRIRSRDGGAS